MRIASKDRASAIAGAMSKQANAKLQERRIKTFKEQLTED